MTDNQPPCGSGPHLVRAFLLALVASYAASKYSHGHWRAYVLAIGIQQVTALMKVYRGTRTENGTTVEVEEDGRTRPLTPRLDLRNHSPTGFEWGYGGSGPAQLALALSADVLGDDDRARDVYQRLKFKLIGGLDRDAWTVTEERVCHAIGQIERERSQPLPPN